jgi:hypothetical protein
MLRSLRLSDRAGLNAHHQDTGENSEGLAVSCAQGDVRAGDPQLPHDVQNLHTGLYILCLLSCLYALWLTWPPAPVWVLACHGLSSHLRHLHSDGDLVQIGLGGQPLHPAPALLVVQNVGSTVLKSILL